MDNVVYSTANDRYALAELNSPNQYTRRCINGKITGCGNCVGYCQYEEHPGFLTEELRRKHNCIGKECYHFIPKPLKEKNKNKCRFQNTYLNEINCCLQQFEGLKVLSVNETNDGLLLRYITITNGYSLEKLSGLLTKKLGCNIDWEKLDYSFDVCTKLLFS